MGIKLGNGKWAAKVNKLLGYKIIHGRYVERSFDFSRSSTTTRVNKSGYVEDVAAHMPRIDYATSPEGALVTESASTNLITYPISFGNFYWTKSGATIEGDSSTAGLNLLTGDDSDFGSSLGNWISLNGGVASWNASGYADISVSSFSQGTEFRSSVAGTNYNGTCILSIDMWYSSGSVTDIEVLANKGLEPPKVQTITTTPTTYYFTLTELNTWLRIRTSSSQTGTFHIDNVIIQPTQGFEAPKEIPVANSEELVTNGTFDTDSDWTKNNTTISGGTANLTGTPSALSSLSQSGIALPTFSKVTFEVTANNGSGTLTGRFSGNTTNTFFNYGEAESVGWHTFYVQDTYGNSDLVFYSNAGTISIDNVSVKEVTSWSGGGLEREAYKLVEDTSSGNHKMERLLVGLSPTVSYSYTLYAKAGERSWIQIRDAVNSHYVNFDLTNGVVGVVVGTTNFSIESLANGWYKCSITTTATSGSQTVFRVSTALSDDDISYQGDGTSGLYIAYAQLEESSYASSLMLPTTEGSTTSRVADACNGSGTAQDFKDYNASGVLYAEIAANSDDLTTSRYISINDGAFNDFIQLLYLNTSNTIRAQLYVGGVMQARIDHVVTDTTVFHKTAFRWYGNTTTAADGRFSLWIDGAMVESEDVSGLTIASGTLTTMDFDYLNGTQNFYGKTRAIAVFDYLSDDQMVKLTEEGYDTFNALATANNFIIR